jgi:chromosome partitioning protein
MSSTPSNSSTAPARTIALMNQKGGVGKTTTAVNLAAGLAGLGRRVMLIDLDPQGHASLHLGAKEPEGEQPTVYDLLLDPGVALAEVLVQARPNLALAAATTDLAGAEPELAGAPDKTLRLRRAIEAYQREQGPRAAEFILIDCPPSLGLLTLNGLSAVREVFIPMQAHFLALQGVGKLMQTVSLVGRTVNPHLHVTGVILCNHDASTSHSREVVADLDAFFTEARTQNVPWSKARVYRPAVRRNVKVAEAPSFGQTIFEYDKWCPGALDYRALAEAIAKEWDEVVARLSAAAPVVVPSAGPASSSPAASR